MPVGGDRQESRRVRASSDYRGEGARVGVGGFLRVPELVVGEVQPAQPEYVRTRTVKQRQVAWYWGEDVGDDVGLQAGSLNKLEQLNQT